MKLKNIIISLLCLFVVSCTTCRDVYKGRTLKETGSPPYLEIVKNYNSHFSLELSYFIENHKVTKDGQIVEKSFTIEDYDTGQDIIIPEKPYSNYLYVKLIVDSISRRSIDIHTILDYGYITEKYEEKSYNAFLRDLAKVKTIGVCNNNLHGRLLITNGKGEKMYKTIFKKGSGYWKDFYNEGQIKEEGEVKNNYKVGEWKYYNKNGEIDSLKTYSIKDSVDVRFPHCLFNKNEPCY